MGCRQRGVGSGTQEGSWGRRAVSADRHVPALGTRARQPAHPGPLPGSRLCGLEVCLSASLSLTLRPPRASGASSARAQGARWGGAACTGLSRAQGAPLLRPRGPCGASSHLRAGRAPAGSPLSPRPFPTPPASPAPHHSDIAQPGSQGRSWAGASAPRRGRGGSRQGQGWDRPSFSPASWSGCRDRAASAQERMSCGPGRRGHGDRDPARAA